MSRKHIAITIIILLNALFVLGQNKKQLLDPSGFIDKYDQNFKGIGPEVYILPAPRTKLEQLTDGYKEITFFQDSIHNAIIFQNLLSTFKHISLEDTTIQLHSSNTIKNDSLIRHFIDIKDYKSAYAVLNFEAFNAFKNKNTQNAITSLEKALTYVQLDSNVIARGSIQSNLATVLLFSGNYIEAGKHEENSYNLYVQNKDLSNQGLSLIKIALIQAYDNDYNSAEKTIIRKAIPLFNKSKNYLGKIHAWITLSEIYQTQNQHPQAQWFLLQAKDLAIDKNYKSFLPLIEYMLASSKYKQNNLSVASKEYIKTIQLAKIENNTLIELAANDYLGQISLKLKNLKEAEKYLKNYWLLHKEIFSKTL